MKYIVKIIGKGLLWGIMAVLVYLNVGLYYQPRYSIVGNKAVNQDVLQQLYYLEQRFAKGLGHEMQGRYPEGFVFVHVLYGLAWTELIAGVPPEHPLYSKGLKEIEFARTALGSNFAQQFFPTNLAPSFGVFYAGWTNYLLGKQLSIVPQAKRSPDLVQQFQEQSLRIAKAFEESSTPYLESYRGLAWPADNVVAIASLALHDQLFRPQYHSLMQKWITKVKQTLDPQTGLIPHEVKAQTAQLMEGAKGSSQSLMNNFLLAIDSSFAKEQFRQYKALFLDYRFGLPGLREYPKGTKGSMDIDSGPVILQIGGSASIVGMRTMAKYDAIEEAVGLRNSIETFGVGYTYNQQKRYLFGLEPMADAFIAWASSVDIQKEEKNLVNWRWHFQLLSALVFLGCAILVQWKGKT